MKITVSEDVNTIGLDLGDTKSTLCMMNSAGSIVSERTVGTNRAALTQKFGRMKRSRIALEACGQSNWIARRLGSFGHEVQVANPRQLHLISKSVKKTDRNDARLLARIGRSDLEFLQPRHVRSIPALAARTVRTLVATWSRSGRGSSIRSVLQRRGVDRSSPPAGTISSPRGPRSN